MGYSDVDLFFCRERGFDAGYSPRKTQLSPVLGPYHEIIYQ
ncbi:hypothetical protein [Aminivibrio sp.]